MNAETLAIGYVVIVVISFIAGWLGRDVLHNRNTVKQLREHDNLSVSNYRESKQRAEDSLEEIRNIRENQRVTE